MQSCVSAVLRFVDTLPLTEVHMHIALSKVLPILRALHKVYGPITVIHFDSHLDTWPLKGYYGSDDTSMITHGTFFWSAAQEGLMQNGTCVHAGIRCKLNVRSHPPVLYRFFLG